MAVQNIVAPNWPPNAIVSDGDTFDFVIAGGGTAGSILANRLTENSNFNVLLVEAGGDPSILSSVIGAGLLLPHTPYDWDQKTVNDNYSSQAHKGKRISFTRGKMLGGSSSINYMFYVRGSKSDYEYWENLGNTGWDPNTTLKYFKKSENMQNEIINNAKYAMYHNTSGPVIVTRPRRTTRDEEFNDNSLDSFNNIGFTFNPDYNGPTQFGISKPYFMFSKPPEARRSSTAISYLVPARDRPNLYVLKNSLVSEIILNGNKAEGIKILDQLGNEIKVYARNEVIISTGTINSAQLLMLSGIGPKDELEKLHINVVADLPVGQHMEDHMFVPLIMSLAPDLLSSLFNIDSITAIFTGLPVPSLVGFFSFDNETDPRPQFQVTSLKFEKASPFLTFFCSVDLTYNNDVCLSLLKENLLNEINFIILSLNHPKSRGKVTLKSTNPRDDPNIYTGYLSDERDLEYMATALEKLVKLKDTRYYSNKKTKIAKLFLPACDNFVFLSRDYWKCYLKLMVGTIWHQSGTCGMGRVVDSFGLVYNTTKLRVVDASIMPASTSGNICAPVMMLAEKISDDIKLILQEWIDKFKNSVNALLAVQTILTPNSPPNAIISDGDRFDFIIAGGGTAGSVLANRLTEIGNFNVLVVEAGGDPPILSTIVGTGMLLSHTPYDWDQYSINDNYTSQAHKGQCLGFTRGKMLGGSSSVNYMYYVRGSSSDYEHWETLGNTGWDPQTTLHYFKKSEDMRNNIVNNPTYAPYHNTLGPVIVTGPRRNSRDEDFNDKSLKSFNEIGFNTNIDYNGPTQYGISKPYFTFSGLPTPRRSSTYISYLVPVGQRSNLKILKYSRVTGIILNGTKAEGIKILKPTGEEIKVYADKEVILSSGTINSAQLLILSGIGPKEDLTNLNINVVADLPVGQQLNDHLFVPLFFSFKPDLLSSAYNADAVISLLSGLGAPSILGFFSLDGETDPRPQLEVISSKYEQASPMLAFFCSISATLSDEVCISLMKENLQHEISFNFLVLNHPKSKGKVTLKNTNPTADANIYTGYFSDNRDLEYMATALEKLITLNGTNYYQDRQAQVVKLNLPSCDIFTFLSRDYLKCYLKQMACTIWHQTGTCGMGRVVDSSGLVYNTTNLRVVDASIMPALTSGNINAPVMMVAEKIADDIKRKYGAL